MVLLFIILLDSIWVLLLIVPVDYALFHTYTLFSTSMKKEKRELTRIGFLCTSVVMSFIEK